MQKELELLEILRPGVQTSVQDQGRFGYGRFGIPPAGSMDVWSQQLLNTVLGNSSNDAVLEMTIVGIKASCLNPCIIALGGGYGRYFLNGQGIEPWQTLALKKGDLLDIGPLTEGCRVYLGVRGGWQVPMVLGSRSTYVPAALGGLEGRTLRKGDVLHGIACLEEFKPRRLAHDFRPRYPKSVEIRVIRGLHSSLFHAGELEKFHAVSYEVSPKSNRMGCRLVGPALKSRLAGNLISDALVTGAIQVPPDGQPIILGADRQTTGGYPVIAVVAAADLSKIGQLAPGYKVRFREISLAEAMELMDVQGKLLNFLGLWGKETLTCGL